jgi:hypothetical protein
MVSNFWGQSKTTQNHTLLAYGAEGAVWPHNRLQLVHNTFYNAALLPARFLHVFTDKLPLPPALMTRNNLLVGIGVFTLNLPGDHQGNHFVPELALGDPATLDFTLGADARLRGSVKPIAPDVSGLQPRFEQATPGHVTPIQDHTPWVPGSIQMPGAPIPAWEHGVDSHEFNDDFNLLIDVCPNQVAKLPLGDLALGNERGGTENMARIHTATAG